MMFPFFLLVIHDSLSMMSPGAKPRGGAIGIIPLGRGVAVGGGAMAVCYYDVDPSNQS